MSCNVLNACVTLKFCYMHFVYIYFSFRGTCLGSLRHSLIFFSFCGIKLTILSVLVYVIFHSVVAVFCCCLFSTIAFTFLFEVLSTSHATMFGKISLIRLYIYFLFIFFIYIYCAVKCHFIWCHSWFGSILNQLFIWQISFVRVYFIVFFYILSIIISIRSPYWNFRTISFDFIPMTILSRYNLSVHLIFQLNFKMKLCLSSINSYQIQKKSWTKTLLISASG